MIDFEERKQKRQRGVTVKELIESTLVNSEDIESIVIVSKSKNGEVLTGFSWDKSLEALGMLEVGKETIIGEMKR